MRVVLSGPTLDNRRFCIATQYHGWHGRSCKAHKTNICEQGWFLFIEIHREGNRSTLQSHNIGCFCFHNVAYWFLFVIVSVDLCPWRIYRREWGGGGDQSLPGKKQLNVTSNLSGRRNCSEPRRRKTKLYSRGIFGKFVTPWYLVSIIYCAMP